MSNTDVPTLYCQKGASRSLIPIFTARACGFPINIQALDRESLKSIDYKKVNDLQKTPSLITNDGVVLETAAIIRYIARKSNSCYGSNAYEVGQIDQWVEYFNTELMPIIEIFAYPYLGLLKPITNHSKSTMADGIALFKKKQEEQNKHIEGKKYFVGDSLSIADIGIFAALYWPFSFAMSEKDRKPFKNVFDWYVKMAEGEWFLGFMGRLRVCSKPWPLVQLPGDDNTQVKGKKEKIKEEKKAEALGKVKKN